MKVLDISISDIEANAGTTTDLIVNTTAHF